MIEKMKWNTSNFEGLVLSCMDSYDSNQILILQHFSRSTRFSYFCTAQISKIQPKIVKIFGGMKKFHFIRVFRWILRFFGEILMKICRNFIEKVKKWQNVSRFGQKSEKNSENARNFRNLGEISFVHFIFSIVSLLKTINDSNLKMTFF